MALSDRRNSEGNIFSRRVPPNRKIPAFNGAHSLNLCKRMSSRVMSVHSSSRCEYYPTVEPLSPNFGLLGAMAKDVALVDLCAYFGGRKYKRSIHTADLEIILVTRTYLIGERLTLADITSTSVIFFPSKYPFDAPAARHVPKNSLPL
ncbi:hypothetical protein EDD16DRAFT_1522363 [Pisolithus croceorrhizus]|nr:hypothetical protein EDD16DRAFT_1522363 [Pisolithus croceorrhizus]KAI6119635.1 hypothetical protein EV401DRAFT_1888109 [Pisolithus croceorrhizus]